MPLIKKRIHKCLALNYAKRGPQVLDLNALVQV